MNDVSPQAALTTAIVMSIVLLAMIGALRRFGIFSRRAFDKAPPRRGVMGFADLVLGVGLLLLGQAAAGAVVLRTHLAGDGGLTARAILVSMVATELGALPAVIYILFRARVAEEGGLAGFGFDPARIPAAVGVAVGTMLVAFPAQFLVSGVIANLLIFIGHAVPTIAHEALIPIRDEPWDPLKIGLILTAVLLAPVVEELLFRGLLQTSLQQSGLVRNRWGAIVITAVLFAAVHAGIAQLMALPALFVLALGLGYAYERSGSLFSSMLIHGTFNAVQIAIAISLTQVQPHAVAGWLGVL